MYRFLSLLLCLFIIVGVAKSQAADYSIPSEALPTQKPTIPQPSWTIGETTININLLGYRDAHGKKLEVYIFDILKGSTPHHVSISAEGKASLTFQQRGPSCVYIALKNVMLYSCVMVEPGKSTDVYIDMFNKASNKALKDVSDVAQKSHLNEALEHEQKTSVYTTGIYRDVNHTYNSLAPLLQEKLAKNISIYFTHKMTASECVDRLIQYYNETMSAIEGLSLAPFDKELLRLYIKGHIIYETGFCDAYRFEDWRKTNNSNDVRAMLKAVERLSAADYKRINDIVNIYDQRLFSIPPIITGAHSLVYNKEFWHVSKDKTDGFLYDLHKACRYFFKARNGELDDEMKDSLSVLDSQFHYKAACNLNDAVLKSIYGVENPSAILSATKLKADSLFNHIIAPHKGKTVVVDFWETWCGPCCNAIRRIKPYKEAELKSDNLVWIYIASSSSDTETYNNMIANIDGLHFRLTKEEMVWMRKKFAIDGIPFYVLVNKDGSYKVRKDFRDLRKMVNVLKGEIE